MSAQPLVIIIMGVAGSGKSTVGKLLAQRLNCDFADADDFHSPENKQKMASGVPLTDTDRRPWLSAIREYLVRKHCSGQSSVIACSALKASYRDVLKHLDEKYIHVIYLKTSPELAVSRLENRRQHFMKSSMVESQFAALEEPSEQEAIHIDASLPEEEIINCILGRISNPGAWADFHENL